MMNNAQKLLTSGPLPKLLEGLVWVRHYTTDAAKRDIEAKKKLKVSKGGKHGGGRIYINVNDPRKNNIGEILMNNWGPTFLDNPDNHDRWEWCIEFPVCSSLLEYHDTFDLYFCEELGCWIPRRFATIIQDMVLDERVRFIRTRDISDYDKDMKEFKDTRLKKK